MTKKAIFLDRDGVINKEVGYLSKIEDFEFIDGVFDAFYYLQSLGYHLIIVTNQSGISRGLFKKSDYERVNHWMFKKFNEKHIKILDSFYCPHGPDSACKCRKPKPGMFLEAKNTYGIDMNLSWMIGDKETDIIAANRAGIQNTILVRSGHKINEANSNALFFLNSISEISQIIT
jgi:D-glycero-D-manno-heptose 1,7-bisphosphate phosphatase